MGIDLCAPIRPILDDSRRRTYVEKTSWPNNTVIPLKGFARCPFTFQEAENPYLRKSLGLPDDVSGVVVRSIPKVSNLHDVLKSNDVIVAIDGIRVSNNGNVSRPPLPQMDFRSIVALKMVGDPMSFDIYRIGEGCSHEAIKQRVDTIAENPPRLCPFVDYSSYTKFVMWGGLVFAPYAHTSAINGDTSYGDYYSNQCKNYLKNKGREFDNPDMQAVVLCSMLPHKVTIGYSMTKLKIQAMPLHKINGKLVDCLFDVADIISSAKSDGCELMEFEFCNDSHVVVPKDKGFEATAEIQKDFGISLPYSANIDEKMKELNKTF